MDVVTGPIGNGVADIAKLNPYAAVLIGGLIVIVVVLWKALNDERRGRLADKEKALEQAHQDKDFYEKLVDRAEGKRRAT
jgi:hypothetical protein